MKSFIVKRLRILFIITLCVVFVNAGFLYKNTIELNKKQQHINNSHQIIIQLERTYSIFKDAQIARDRYLISNNQDYLKSFSAATKQIDINLELLKKLSEDDYQKQQQILLLDKKIIDIFNRFGKELYLTNNIKFNFYQDLAIKNDIKKLIYSIKITEKKLLLSRIKNTEISFKKATVAFFVGDFFNLALVGQLYYLLKSYIFRLKKIKIALRQSENRLRAIIDAEPESIQLINKDGTLLEINASGLTMMEVESSDKIIGLSVYSTVTQQYQKAYRLMHESVCRGNKETLEFEIIGFKGTRRWMETHAVPVASETDGSFLHLAITRDITQRKLSEQKLYEQAALLDLATNAILVKDIYNRILYWNKGAENIYGWQASEVYGKKTSRLLHKEHSSQQDDALLNVIKTGKWQGELHQVTKEGKDIIVESRWTLLQDDKGKPKSILVENTEITQKKQLETQLLRTQRLESIGTLAGGIAHDLNNLLTPILMSVQLLERKLHDSQHLSLLKTLENNAQRGANLIKQLLSFARGIEGKRTLIQIKYLIVEIEQIVRETFPKSIKLTVNISPDNGYVRGDMTQLHQVLMNLVVNARDAMPGGGKLEISVENVAIDQYDRMNLDANLGVYIVVTVADTGIGMHPEIQERIFEPFFTTKELGKGTGLGLSTALGIVKNHGGFINVYSQLNQGTAIKIYLPMQVTEETSILCSDEVENLNGNGELILLVDDEPAIRNITKSSLEAYNYRVLTASNGIEAIEIYAKHQQEINLVLLDMIMPEMDGETTMRMLHQINSQVKIIAISGLVLNPATPSKSGYNVKAVVSKPCTGKELLQVINKVSS